MKVNNGAEDPFQVVFSLLTTDVPAFVFTLTGTVTARIVGGWYLCVVGEKQPMKNVTGRLWARRRRGTECFNTVATVGLLV